MSLYTFRSNFSNNEKVQISRKRLLDSVVFPSTVSVLFSIKDCLGLLRVGTNRPYYFIVPLLRGI